MSKHSSAFAKHASECPRCGPEPSHSLECEEGRLLHLAMIEEGRAAERVPAIGADFGQPPPELPHETVEGDPDAWPGCGPS